MRKAKLYVSDWPFNWKTRRLDRRSVFCSPIGGARRNRTDDLMLAKHALSQLSYGPAPEAQKSESQKSEARTQTFWLLISGFWLLAAGGDWWAWEDLNLRPHAYQARALTN